MSTQRKRLRSYIREGWHYVEVPKIKSDWGFYGINNMHNKKHFHEMRVWCWNNFPEGTWHGRCTDWNSINGNGVKRFVFKEAKHATWFRLKWTTIE